MSDELIPFDLSYFNRIVDQLFTKDRLSITRVNYVKINRFIYRGRKIKTL